MRVRLPGHLQDTLWQLPWKVHFWWAVGNTNINNFLPLRWWWFYFVCKAVHAAIECTAGRGVDTIVSTVAISTGSKSCFSFFFFFFWMGYRYIYIYKGRVIAAAAGVYSSKLINPFMPENVPQTVVALLQFCLLTTQPCCSYSSKLTTNSYQVVLMIACCTRQWGNVQRYHMTTLMSYYVTETDIGDHVVRVQHLL